MAPSDVAKPLEGIGTRRGAVHLEDAFKDRVKGREQYLVSAGEVLVEARFGQPGFSRNAGHRGSRNSVRDHQVQSDVNDLLQPGFALLSMVADHRSPLPDLPYS